jgi:hypothetical protein
MQTCNKACIDSTVFAPVCGRMRSATSAVGRIIALRMNIINMLLKHFTKIVHFISGFC